MNILDIKNIVTQAISEKRGLDITGYVSSSGEVADYGVTFIGPEGYRELIQQSFDQVIKDLPLCPDDISAGVWATAIQEKLASWRRTLEGGNPSRKSAAVRDPGGFYTMPDNVGAIYIQHLRKDYKVVQTSDGDGGTKSELSRAKELLQDLTPSGKYIFQFKLSEASVSDIILRS